MDRGKQVHFWDRPNLSKYTFDDKLHVDKLLTYKCNTTKTAKAAGERSWLGKSPSHYMAVSHYIAIVLAYASVWNISLIRWYIRWHTLGVRYFVDFCFTVDTLCSGLFEIWRFSVQRIWYVMLGFFRNMKIFCSENLFWFQSYWSRDILHRNFRLLFGNSMVVIQTLFTNLTPLCHMTGFQLFSVNRYGCHMWDRKCSLFLEHIISLPLGSSWFHPFIIYTLHNLCKDYVYGLKTVVCLD